MLGGSRGVSDVCGGGWVVGMMACEMAVSQHNGVGSLCCIPQQYNNIVHESLFFKYLVVRKIGVCYRADGDFPYKIFTHFQIAL